MSISSYASDSSAASNPHSYEFSLSDPSRQSGMVQPVIQDMFATVHAAGSSLLGLFTSCTTFDSTGVPHRKRKRVPQRGRGVAPGTGSIHANLPSGRVHGLSRSRGEIPHSDRTSPSLLIVDPPGHEDHRAKGASQFAKRGRRRGTSELPSSSNKPNSRREGKSAMFAFDGTHWNQIGQSISNRSPTPTIKI
eukprot:scaffold6362_cov123-Isochrysis_galbana.AAC.2